MPRSCVQLLLVICLAIVSGVKAHAQVDEALLQARLAQLAPLAERGLDIQAFQREVSYELQRLSTAERARLEAQLLTSRIQQATAVAYEMALREFGSHDEALAAVREYVDGDLAQVTPELNPFIKQLTEDVLANGSGATVNSFPEPMLAYLTTQSESRQQMLAQTELTSAVPSNRTKSATASNAVNPSSGSNLSTRARGVRSYRTKAEFLRALVSGDESERWVATANTVHRTEWAMVSEIEFTGQVKVSFLGSEVSGGPRLKFVVRYSSKLDIKGEGIYPLFDSRGYFDLDWRDASGRVQLLNGRPQRRFVFFTCDAMAEIESEAGAGGTLKLFGVGAEGRASSRWVETTEVSSRRVLVPDTVDGRQTTRASLTNICLQDFLNVRTATGRSIRTNMLTSLRNAATSLVYSNPGMQCVRDNHCTNWFNRRWRINRINAVPRCVQANGNSGLMVCQTRGREGARCPLRSNGITNIGSLGVLEHPCDTGFQCVRVATIPLGTLLPITSSIGECRRRQ